MVGVSCVEGLVFWEATCCKSNSRKMGHLALALAHSKCLGRSRAPTSGVDSVVCGGVVKSVG